MERGIKKQKLQKLYRRSVTFFAVVVVVIVVFVVAVVLRQCTKMSVINSFVFFFPFLVSVE